MVLQCNAEVQSNIAFKIWETIYGCKEDINSWGNQISIADTSKKDKNTTATIYNYYSELLTMGTYEWINWGYSKK